MIRDLIRSVSGYPGLFLFCAVSGLAVPLPEDFSLLYAGMAIADGRFTLAPVLTVTLVGVLVRDLLAWGIGRLLGPALLSARWFVALLGVKKIARAQALVLKHGGRSVLVGRALVGFRAPVFVVGGATGVPLRTFLLWDGLGLLLVVPLTVALGYWVGQPLVDGVFWALQRARVGVALFVFGALAYLAVQRARGVSEE